MSDRFDLTLPKLHFNKLVAGSISLLLSFSCSRASASDLVTYVSHESFLPLLLINVLPLQWRVALKVHPPPSLISSSLKTLYA